MATTGAMFTTLLEASLRAGAVLVLVLGLRWLLRRAGQVRLLDLLWLVVLVRLLIPAMPAAPWSGFNLLAGADSGQPRGHAGLADTSGAAGGGVAAGAVLAPAPPVLPSAVPAGAALPLRSGPATLAAAAGVGPGAVFLMMWAAGTLLLLGVAVRSSRATRALLRRSRPVEDPAAVASLLFIQRRLGLRRPPRLHQSAEIDSPALAGWWRPVVLVPAGLLPALSPEARVHVLMHEIGHLRRQDLWVQRLFKLAVALHWWNPLVWLASRLARADRELACDDWVLRRLRDIDGRADDPCAYGETLLALSLASSMRGRALPTGMAEDGHRLSDRVRRIAGWQRAGGWRAVLGLALAGAFAVALLANEHPGPLRPLPFKPALDAPAGDWLQVDGVWGDAGSFGQARRLRLRGHYRVAGCQQAVLVVESLGTENPEPSAKQVRLVPCGAGEFELDFRVRDGAPGGVAVALMNARGACGLAAVAVTPTGRPWRAPARSVREVCWRTGKRVSPGYQHLSWVGDGDSVLPDLPLTPARSPGRSDSLAEGRSAILFENHSPRVVFLHWMDFRGRPRLWGFLSPGETFRAWTTRNHIWTVASERGEPLGTVKAERHPGRAVIR